MAENCVGPTNEWHLVFPKAVQEIAFGLMSRFHETIVGFGSPLSSARFKPIGAIGDSVDCDRSEQAFVEDPAAGRVLLALDRNHRLEGFQRLDRSLETDRSRLDVVLGCGLSDDGADKIVGQQACPDFLPNKLRGFAPQDVHICSVCFSDLRSNSAFHRAR